MYDMGRQSRQRLKAWREVLKDQLYTVVMPAVFQGFTTFERLTPDEAGTKELRPFPPGTAWGKCWEYGWFFTQLTLPPLCEGQRVILSTGLGGEQLVYVNGEAVGSIDLKHPYVTLTRNAKAGEHFRIAVESYAGHGARLESLGPCPPEKNPLPPVPESQCRVAPGGAAIWDEDAYQLLLDVETLARLLEVLPDRSLRAMKVAQALDDFTHVANFELPREQRRETYRAARKVLAPALQCRNGSTAPLFVVMGQSHIDLGWLWPVEETYHKASRTYANQLTLMKEYPEYRFLSCEPALLEMLRSHSPSLWEQLLEAHQRGQIIPDGAFFVECDTNIPSGESLIRQLMLGKRWFREHFGADSQVAWQPDTFGFSGALPQLLLGFGIPYFATQKMLRADPEYPRFPYQNFMWEGIDGSTVQALSFFRNNSGIEPVSFHDRWEKDRVQQDHIDTLLFPFGYGDGGGGPTRDFVELARRLTDLEGLPRSRYGTLQEYFELSRESAEHNRWVGEIYLQWHRGTYTAQRRAKALSRRLEERLHDADLLLSQLPETEREEPQKAIEKAWRTLLFHQFHDIAAGVGIERVHREETEALQSALETLDSLIDHMAAQVFDLKPSAGKYMLFNPLPWAVEGFVDLPDGSMVYQHIPPSGIADAVSSEPEPGDVSAVREDDSIVLQNRFLRAVVGPDGRITSLKLLGTNQEYADETGLNDWQLYQDVECVYDAWEMSHDATDCPWNGASSVQVRLTLNTPQRAEVTVERRFSESCATQVIRLDACSEQLNFVNHIDWHERHMLLKIRFATNILCRDAVHEIQFGCIRRPAHRSDAFSAAQYEVCQHRYSALCDEGRGLALLNNGSYGISCDRGEMALTLLKAPLVPDPTCDRGAHDLSFALLPFTGPISQSRVVRAGYEFNQQPRVLKGIGHVQEGPAADTVILETIKVPEEGEGVILRLYEPSGKTCKAELRLPVEGRLEECGLAENEHVDIGSGDIFSLDFRPFQIRTFRFVSKLRPEVQK